MPVAQALLCNAKDGGVWPPCPLVGPKKIWPPPPENPEPGEPPDVELRFKVGDRVECCIARGPNGWAPGTIVSHWFRAPQWPTGRELQQGQVSSKCEIPRCDTPEAKVRPHPARD